MIGNDIVDLTQARRESNWRRAGFLDKIFTLHEQQLIHTANNPDCVVWLLWSMKESVYKVVSRQTGKRVLAPQKIACQIIYTQAETVEGVVSYEGTYHTRSLFTDRYVATTASPQHTYQPISQSIILLNDATYQTQYTAVRNAIKQHCSAYFSTPGTSIHIHKNETGAPTLRIDTASEMPLNLPLSISHHGHYVAYAIELP